MKLYQIIIYIILTVSLTGCISNNPESIPTTNNSADSFRVALLLPRTIDADGWNQAGYEGLLLIEEELNVEVAYSEAVPEAEFEQVFRQYAEDNYDFIIGHGAQFVGAAEIVAAEFPRTRFAVLAKYEGNNQNLGSFSLDYSEIAYLAGAIAALKTQTKHIAFLSGAANETNELIAQAFERGAIATNPDIEVSLEWTGSWTDEDRATELTRELIDKNVDVILVVAGQTAPHIHQLAAESGIYTIGWSVDQYSLAPGSVLVSIIENVANVLLQGTTLARRGQWEGKQYLIGMSENGLYLSPFRNSLTPEQEAQVTEIQNAIIAGEIDTG